MWFKDFLKQQQSGLEAMANTGVIGLHLVSGPAVGFAIGYGLDRWLGTSPWCKLIFLVVGIGAGFLNVYRDTRALLRKIEAQDAARRAAVGQPPAAGATKAQGPQAKAAPKAANSKPAPPKAASPAGVRQAAAEQTGVDLAAASPKGVRQAAAEQDGLTQRNAEGGRTAAQRQPAHAGQDEQGATDVPRH